MAESIKSKAPKSESKQFVINVSANAIVMLVNIVIGLWYTPYLIKNLGVATYGIVILATSLTQYMSIFNSSIDNAVGRFLTLDIRKQAAKSANLTFNTAFWSGLSLSLFLLPIVVVIAWFAPQLFNVPEGQERSAQLLFVAVMSSYLLIILRSIFSASAFAHNRLDLKNTIIISNTLVRVLVVISLFTLATQPQAWQVGCATLAGAFISFILAISIWHELTPELGIRRKMFDHARWKDMFSMSGWLIVNQVGTLLFLNIDLIVVNRYLGPEAQGRYGSILQLVILLRTLAAAIATAITPIALAQLARDDTREMLVMTRRSVKWMGLIIALPIGGLVGFSVPFLTLWLGAEFASLAVLLTVLTVHLCINLAVRPLFSIQTALNKVRLPGIVTILLGLVNLILALWWAEWERYGLGVALAGAIVLTAKNALFTPIYGAYIQKVPWYTFIKELSFGIGGTFFVGGGCLFLVYRFSITEWSSLIFASGVVSIIYLGLLFFVFLSKEERVMLLAKLKPQKDGQR